MNTKKGNVNLGWLAVGLGVALVLAGGWGVFNAGKNAGVGSALTYSAALSRIETYNFLEGVSKDLNKIASSTGHSLAASATWNPNLVSSSTVATTTVTVTGAVVGDFALANLESTTSSEKWSISARVSANNTVLVTLSHNDAGLSGDTLDLTAQTLNVRVLQQGTFTLQTSTSSSP